MPLSKRIFTKVITIFVVNILIVTLFQFVPKADASVYRQGSTGDTVRQIQTRLKNWGYYTGSVDGIYGDLTVRAVKYFQSKNGLAVDGITGSQTLNKLGLPAGKDEFGASSSREDDLYLIARMVSAEARGEPYIGQVAVAAVILNRVDHPSFPNTVAGVIYQPGAFSAIDDGQFNSPISDSARRAAEEALNGSDPVGGAIYYYNPSKATNQWIRSRPVVKTIGSHVFCK